MSSFINTFEKYIHSISKKFRYFETSEMGYRKEFEILLEDIFESINVSRIDHDAKAIKGNKPDFRIMKFGIPILYIEAKDIGVSLDRVEKSEQMARYFGYANLVLTDYVEFRFYRNGQRYDEPIKVAEYDTETRIISPLPDSYEHAAKTLIDFTQSHKEPIKSGLHLAKIMGGKAQRIRDNLLQFLSVESEKNTEINKIFNTLKKLLVHDLKTEAFADMYAQTVVYGLFVARYFDETPNDFSRREARDLVPKSNPFLRHFFDHITGADFDKRLEYIVDELCMVFSHANVSELMKQYFSDDLWGKTHEGPDPVIHFYEDFLKEYDPDLRKKMGAYYTPQPVVRFIVRAVDYLLDKEFGLPNGLADTTKLDNGTHKVQILDPAVGTGTFLSAVIRNIYRKLEKTGQIGRWPAYVHHDLLPRIHGFEIMMAPYTIAHLKLSMAFKATGFKHFNRRLGIYLTNSLEEADDFGDFFTGFGFADSIAEESKEANQIKSETPIMVVLGNPPYSVSSSNKGKWITNLIKEYKKNLNERNIQPLSDDYIKFIRYAENFVEKNKTGIVAMITNNSFLDGIIHRQMRKHLLETFDEIYILDLHGNAKKKETAPDGSKDQNVFDIMQGVAISIMIKKSDKREKLGVVKFAELYGKRSEKFEKLNSSELNTITWKKLKIVNPNYFFTPKDFSERIEYELGFELQKIFTESGSGTKFRKDNLLVKKHFTSESVKELLIDMNSKENSYILNKYKFKETSDWQLNNKKKFFLNGKIEDIRLVQYRPFDMRYTFYPLKDINEIIPRGDSRHKLMKNFFYGKNVGLLTKRGQDFSSAPCFVTNSIVDIRVYSPPGVQGTDYVFPLFLYSKDGTKVPNLNHEILEQIEKIVEKTEPKEIFDYIYAALHSPSYRNKYKEFLKIDFPRVPYPKDKTTFKELVKFGTELRQIHLLESPKVGKFITTFPNMGSDTVEKIKYIDGRVLFNEEQYFGNVPEIAWNFYIGGYQPAQKWLKDRKGRPLTNEEIEHYQKIIVALVETDRIMREIDEVVRV